MPKSDGLQIASWRVYGPHFESYESPLGGLSIDYSDGVDTRWNDFSVLGPKTTALTLDSSGETAADANGMVLTDGMNATLYAIIIRGTDLGKVNVSTKAVIDVSAMTAFATAPTDIIKTKTAAGTEEISIAFANAEYRVIATVGAGADTHAANSASAIIRIFGHGFPGDFIAALGRSGGAGTRENVVYSIELTGSVTMAAPTLITKAAIAEDLQFTGFALDGVFWIPMTNRGPVYYDSDLLRYRFLLPEQGQDTANGRQAMRWSFLGTIYPTTTGLRYQKNIFDGGSIGPEVFKRNMSPVRGQPDGLSADARWLYASIYNPTTGDTYMACARPNMEGDGHSEMLSWFTLYKVAGQERVKFVKDIDTAGNVLTNPEVWHGYGSDVMYFKKGRTDRWIDDSNYRYASSGSLYLTEMRRFPYHTKRPRGFVIDTADCSSTQTVTVALKVDGRDAVTVGKITKNGRQWVNIPDIAGLQGERIQPVLTLATGSDSATPKVRGEFLLAYDLVPMINAGRFAEWLKVSA